MKSSPANAMMRLRSSDGWKAKSNPASVLTTGSRAMRSAALIRRFSRSDSSSSQQFVERLDAVDLALFDPAQGGIEHLERSRHPQADQTVADIVDPRGRRRVRHGRPPVASWLPIAS